MERTVAGVVEHLFTSVNPQTGSRPPERIAWAVFAGGTVFFATPSDDLPPHATPTEVAAAARRALRELGPVVAGSPAADFSTTLLDGWFPGESVYFITYDHPSIANVILDGDGGELAAGLIGRQIRAGDHASMTIDRVRDFSGRTYVLRGPSN